MRNHRELMRALAQADLDDLTRRLLAYAAFKQVPDPKQRVTEAIREAADDEHHHLYGKRLSLFAFLCQVITK